MFLPLNFQLVFFFSSLGYCSLIASAPSCLFFCVCLFNFWPFYQQQGLSKGLLFKLSIIEGLLGVDACLLHPWAALAGQTASQDSDRPMDGLALDEACKFGWISWGEDAGAVTGFPQKRQWSYFRNWEYKRFPPDAESPLNLRLSPARGESKPGICPWRIRSWWRRERESDTCQINRVHVVENGKRAHVFSGTNDSPQPYQIPSLGQYD